MNNLPRIAIYPAYSEKSLQIHKLKTEYLITAQEKNIVNEVIFIDNDNYKIVNKGDLLETLKEYHSGLVQVLIQNVVCVEAEYVQNLDIDEDCYEDGHFKFTFEDDFASLLNAFDELDGHSLEDKINSQNFSFELLREVAQTLTIPDTPLFPIDLSPYTFLVVEDGVTLVKNNFYLYVFKFEGKFLVCRVSGNVRLIILIPHNFLLHMLSHTYQAESDFYFSWGNDVEQIDEDELREAFDVNFEYGVSTLLEMLPVVPRDDEIYDTQELFQAFETLKIERR